MLKTRFPVKAVVYAVGAWLVVTSFLWVFGVPHSLIHEVGMADGLFRTEMELVALLRHSVQKDNKELASLRSMTPQQEKQVEEIRANILQMAANADDRHSRADERIRDGILFHYYRISVFAFVVVGVVLLGNWLIHRYAQNPLGIDYDSP